MEIALAENSRMSQADLAFKVAACNIQLREHWAPAYLEEPWPANSYKTLAGLSAGSFWPIAILDDIDEPGALGFHDWVAGLAYGRVMANADPLDATTESHEILELRGDATCSIWLPMPDGRRVAREIADPVQSDTYTILVTIGSETRNMIVSDFILPSWFLPGAPGPYSFRDNVDEPFGLSRNGGGWRLVKDIDGEVRQDFGKHARPRMTSHPLDPLSRTYRRGVRR